MQGFGFEQMKGAEQDTHLLSDPDRGESWVLELRFVILSTCRYCHDGRNPRL